jgi:dienelactone hydrolase
MSSIIEGFSYDVFISYRQKDNKYDGWVTEFVDNLNRELDSMFKDQVTVYFDVNPSDYLLESYDVDASLKEKLKCLIFIPILSRTYCDPKSFAWDNEFRAFVNLASNDRFGFKIKLPGGNVANRVLPVRIHDLDHSDIKLFESVVGGLIRSIDFVYKETGVNRQLRAKDDEIIIRTSGQSLYRDQINKVALAIKEIIESMKLHDSTGHKKEKEPSEAHEPVSASENSPDPANNMNYVSEKGIGLTKKEKKLPLISMKIVLALLAGLVILTGVIITVNHRSKVKWAKEVALPQINNMILDDATGAFNLAQEAEKYIADDPEFRKIKPLVFSKLTLLSDPPGADVYIKEYSDTSNNWKKVGITPLDSIRFPWFNVYKVKFEKPGYESVHAVTITLIDTLYRKLFPVKSIPDGMVYVEGYKAETAGKFLNKNKAGFFIDRYEVTNRQFREFVEKGGYTNPDYWKNEFIKDGKKLTMKEAMIYFTDKTGQPGPAGWMGGTFPQGEDDYPVSGISWYEASAYAEYAGKSLPTTYHWLTASGRYIKYINDYVNSRLLPISNFSGKGPEPIGITDAISSFGACDMAGNVREWCENELNEGKILHGGAWDDASYLYHTRSSMPAFDRSLRNGFRCVVYSDKDKIPPSDFAALKITPGRDITKMKPVNDDVFIGFRNQFLYDKRDLKPIIEMTDSSDSYRKVEKISFNAAYENERLILYLFIPANAKPPYQTVIFFPGSYAFTQNNLLTSKNYDFLFDFIIRGKRAVAYPVYKGTYERKFKRDFTVLSHQYTDWNIKVTQDLSRSIDYLETRSDIDTTRFAFFGHSWGGTLGFIIPAVEKRLNASVLFVGGWVGEPYPEIDPVNYLPRIRIPVLMLNGRYDVTHPYETAVKPYYDLLGTPEKDRKLILYETDHYVSKADLVRETLGWFDKYLGPVK